jgi:GntR family transcriptional regulator/MocR family aminotransferase
VCYLGTLAKVFAPGLRLGYIAATPDVIARIASYRRVVDLQGDHVLERAVAELLADGTLERHVRRARRTYRDRRDALCAALRREMPELEFEPPHGGVALWLRAPGIDVDHWVERAAADDVAFQPASRFALDGKRRDCARLGFGACTERQLAEAARRLAACVPGPRRRR